MMLYLVRHAQARSKNEDPERHLSDLGVAQVEDLADTLRTRGDLIPVRVFHSGKARARETAEILALALGVREVITDRDALKPGADPAEWGARLEGNRDDLMLVGHLPHMARLAGFLLEGDDQVQAIAFDTATAVALRRDEDGRWHHVWSETGAGY